MAQSEYVLYSPIPRVGDNVATLIPVMPATQVQSPAYVVESPGYKQVDPALCRQLIPLSFHDAFSMYPTYTRIASNMYYARGCQLINGRYNQPATILMILREDGHFGFPGGHIERSDPSIVQGLNRELREEINITQKNEVVLADHLYATVCHSKQLVFHFFAHEVSLGDLAEIERRVTDATYWGKETFGLVRVPLYTMEDGYHGFPVFLSNKFSSEARELLLFGIQQRKLLPPEQLKAVVDAANEYIIKQTS